MNNKYKTSLCRHWEQEGSCPLGAKCQFAHGKQEIRKISDPLPPSNPMLMNRNIAGNLPGMQAFPSNIVQKSPLQGQVPSNYKTAKCKFFEQGFCKFMENCSFAHGDQELRKMDFTNNIRPMNGNSPSIPPKFPTKRQWYPPKTNGYEDMNMIAQQQLSFLINELEKYHSNDPQYLSKIKSSRDLNTAGSVQAAANAIYSIINRGDKNQEDAQKYSNLLSQMQQQSSYLNQQYPIQYMPNMVSNVYSPPLDYTMGYPDIMVPQTPYYCIPNPFMSTPTNMNTTTMRAPYSGKGYHNEGNFRGNRNGNNMNANMSMKKRDEE